MEDTGFHVPKEKLARFVRCYQPRPAGVGLTVYDNTSESQWTQPPAFPDAAGGLVSTADDYLKFAQMLLAKGRHGKRRVLAEDSVDAMTSNSVLAE
jgi:CubicO group peptidase (beta-lactamase class C family)